MRVPGATYRLQFNARFRFSDARALVPYLHRLGITDLYSSALLAARPGSTHGYDVVDARRLNPELGTKRDFQALVQELQRQNMGLLLDIVPNHMAAGPENPWWADILENGPISPYAGYLDIDWSAAEDGKLVLPILGGPYREVLESGELSLAMDGQGLCVRYHDARLPLDPKSYRAVLALRLEGAREVPGADDRAAQELLSLIDAIDRLPERTETPAERVRTRQRDGKRIARRLWELYGADRSFRKFLDENIRIFNNTRGSSEGLRLLDMLLAAQAYRLACWRTGTREINYRRFFDISDLVGVRVEDSQVFDATHALVLRLAEAGSVTGLRVDHIDGLYDPAEYLQRLQEQLPPRFYVIVEKVLTGEEPLPQEWAVSGTTGYDFLNTVNGVLVDPRGLEAMNATYRRFTGRKAPFANIVYEQKRRVVRELFEGELRRLAHQLSLLAEQDTRAPDLSPQDLQEAQAEVAACFPVYRTYVRDLSEPPRDRAYIERAIAEARRRNPEISSTAFDFLRRVLLLDMPSSLGKEQREAWLCFVMRWQQFTGPTTAKGLEDTALYLHNRLTSVNEVGADPDGTGAVDVATFHRRNRARLRQWPHSLNATSTHDTKRSEDVRARINVLSELAAAWARRLGRWSRLNRDKKRAVRGKAAPDANEEVLLYQTILGAWPLGEGEVPGFKERLKAYMTKALREAKVHTSWLDPDSEYERAVAEFVESILSPAGQNGFLEDLLGFQQRVAYYGMINSLAQVLLKVGSPGLPDFYQGSELWDFSLVDPDNRRPVDFRKRIELLEELKRREVEGLLPLARELLDHWRDGRIKLHLTARALAFRSTHRRLFSEGDYLPLPASGDKKEHIVAFARRRARTWAVVAVPRLVASLSPAGKPPLGESVWGETFVRLPAGAPRSWRNVLTGETVAASGGGRRLSVGSLFAHLPVALLRPAAF